MTLEPVAFAGLVGAVTGALLGGTLGLLGVFVGAREARKRERRETRRAGYADFLADAQRFHDAGLRAALFTDQFDDARERLKSTSARAKLAPDAALLAELEALDRDLNRAAASGVKIDDYQSVLRDFQRSRLNLWLLAPRLIRQLSLEVVDAMGTDEFSTRLGRFIVAARADIDADEDGWKHRPLRAYFERPG